MIGLRMESSVLELDGNCLPETKKYINDNNNSIKWFLIFCLRENAMTE